MKKMYVDIGELGWSLYLSAHVRWLKQHADDHIGVMTFANRRCLYDGMADAVYNVPDDFCKKFNCGMASYFGLQGGQEGGLRDYFTEHNPGGYKIEGFFGFWKGFREQVIFKPYAYSKKLSGNKEILIFPRYRIGGKFRHRNLPEEFYIMLINMLCDEFPELTIRTSGVKNGAYNISVDKPNYINWIGKERSLQDLIDNCQLAIATVGGISAPPKITLLQGIPTFMIGYPKGRYVEKENWMSTKVGFYEVPNRHYDTLDIVDCINKIISFIKECQ